MLLRSVGYTKYLSFNPFLIMSPGSKQVLLCFRYLILTHRRTNPLILRCGNHLQVVYNLVLCKIRGPLFLRAFGWDHKIVLAVTETQNLGNIKLEVYYISLLHVLRHIEDVHIKKFYFNSSEYQVP